MSRIVFAQVSTQLLDSDGMPNNIKENDAWDADSALVQLHPRMFGPQPTFLMPHGRPPVEAATAAPGERRRVG